MRHETILLSVPEATAPAELIAYVPDNFPELGMDRRRPALIICPGGGYAFLSDREGEPVALRFAGLGYAAFVLRYHTAPQAHYPIPQRQLLSAIDHVRTHAQEYHVDPSAIVAMGFPPEDIWRAAPPFCGTGRRSSGPWGKRRPLTAPTERCCAIRWCPPASTATATPF